MARPPGITKGNSQPDAHPLREDAGGTPSLEVPGPIRFRP